MLWKVLRKQQIRGYKFRRQHPYGNYVLDFVCLEARLVIEVDGPIHNQQQQIDKARQDILEELGLTVFRINTEIAEKNLPIALDMIRHRVQEIKQNLHFSSPLVGEG